MQFRTEVDIAPPGWTLDYQSQVLTVGSCFAEVLGGQLAHHRFPVLNNPLGTVFNPYSIAKLLTMAVENTPPAPDLYLKNADGIWLHYDFHSSFWAHSREALENKLTECLARVQTWLAQCQVLVVTLGSAYVYRYKHNLALVTNCHKTPQSEFIKEMLGHDHVYNVWDNLLRSSKIKCRVILTVSPVRHTRDTLPLNQVSKSTLRVLCHRLSEQFGNVSYFPAYEIMLDELRDYRYYEADLIHPSVQAEAYIFQKFMASHMDSDALTTMKAWDVIQKMLAHRPQHGSTESYRRLLENVQNKLEEIRENIPVEAEIQEVKAKLAQFSSVK